MPLGVSSQTPAGKNGRGRYLDNIFPSHGLQATRVLRTCRAVFDRLWRPLKQEAVYLHEITNGFQVKRIIDDWVGFYNSERPHTAPDNPVAGQ